MLVVVALLAAVFAVVSLFACPILFPVAAAVTISAYMWAARGARLAERRQPPLSRRDHEREFIRAMKTFE